jgi:hypothetical protein
VIDASKNTAVAAEFFRFESIVSLDRKKTATNTGMSRILSQVIRFGMLKGIWLV